MFGFKHFMAAAWRQGKKLQLSIHAEDPH